MNRGAASANQFSRRDFIEMSSAALAATAVNTEAQEGLQHYPLGLQFYSFSSIAAGGWDHYTAAMEKAKAIGFDSLELAGLGAYRPEPIRKKAAELGLAMHSFHMGNDQVRAFYVPGPDGNTVQQAQDAVYTPLGVVEVCRVNLPIARDLGCEWGVIAASGRSNFKTRDTILRLCDAFNESNRMAQAKGLRLSYHMHATDFERVDGEMAFKQLIEHTDPAIRYQLDVCWAVAGGVDPAELVQLYPDRLVSFHLKDLTVAGKATTAGDGVVNFKSLFSACTKVQDPLFYVELEGGTGPGLDSSKEATRAYNYLYQIGWGNKAAGLSSPVSRR